MKHTGGVFTHSRWFGILLHVHTLMGRNRFSTPGFHDKTFRGHACSGVKFFKAGSEN